MSIKIFKKIKHRAWNVTIESENEKSILLHFLMCLDYILEYK